jgi:2-methylcitrate dehydratase PrpD
MHSPAQVNGKEEISGAIAAFIVAPHSGSAFALACEDARRTYVRARLTAERPGALATTVEGAMTPFSGSAFARALAVGAAFASDPALAADAAILATAIVAAERAGADEVRAAEAIVVGREVERRVIAAVADAEFEHTWNLAAIGSRFGAVAVATRLAGLDAAVARHALGVAATQAAGTASTTGTSSGALACGKAASDALEAVALARHGFTSAPASIEGRRGFAALMATRLDPAAILDGLGERWGV